MAATSPKPRRGARLLTVAEAARLSPSMIRVTFEGPEIADMPGDCAGANCKLLLPDEGEGRDAFAARLAGSGAKPVTRTYTVRAIDPVARRLVIDFVDHGEGGPASAWARRAGTGDFLGFAGPGPAKVKDVTGDFWLIGADLSALPVAAVTLETLPADAKGLAVFEIPHQDDRMTLIAPEGMEVRWLIHPDPHTQSKAQEEALRAAAPEAGRLRACVAGEHGAASGIRSWLLKERGLPAADVYAAGYWKIGLIEDEHQAFKRSEAA